MVWIHTLNPLRRKPAWFIFALEDAVVDYPNIFMLDRVDGASTYSEKWA